MELYKSLAYVYDDMYQHLFDYAGEFDFYRQQLKKYECRSVIEFGCGTGHLGAYFTQNEFEYLGVDLHQEMVNIASNRCPDAHFMVGDVCYFKPPSQTKAVLLTGRTLTYFTGDEQIVSVMSNIHNCLLPNGIFIFDAIDGPALLSKIDGSPEEIIVGPYKRISTSTPNTQFKWSWDWECDYYQMGDSSETYLGHDEASLRALDHGEMDYFLSKTGFRLLERIPKGSYTWNDAYFVCQKM